MASINIDEDIKIMSNGVAKLSISTSSDDMPSFVFAIEVLPASRDKVCTKYRFSHICSVQELNEWPTEEDPDMCYFRTNEIEMLFDTINTALLVLNHVKYDIKKLVKLYNETLLSLIHI